MATKKGTTAKSKTATTKPENASEESTQKQTNPVIGWLGRHKVIVIIVLLILGALGYLAYTNKDLAVAATVNGQPIYRHTLLITSEQVAGPQVLDQLVTEQIIYQAANKRGLTVEQEDLDKAYNELKEQYQAQGVNIETLMQENNVSQQEIEKNLRPQILQDKLITAEGIAVTDKEVDAFFEENEDLLPEDPAELETTRKNVMQSLRAEKAQEFLQKLRAEAKVNYYFGQ